MSADGGQTFRYKFSRKVKLGENIYSPPLITTKPLNATLLFVPAAGLSHSEGSFFVYYPFLSRVAEVFDAFPGGIPKRFSMLDVNN